MRPPYAFMTPRPSSGCCPFHSQAMNSGFLRFCQFLLRNLCPQTFHNSVHPIPARHLPHNPNPSQFPDNCVPLRPSPSPDTLRGRLRRLPELLAECRATAASRIVSVSAIDTMEKFATHRSPTSNATCFLLLLHIKIWLSTIILCSICTGEHFMRTHLAVTPETKIVISFSSALSPSLTARPNALRQSEGMGCLVRPEGATIFKKEVVEGKGS